jgi:hypothetical protein
MMTPDFEQLDLRTLLELYLQETKAFSAALGRGADWNELETTRLRIRELSAYINRKSKEEPARGHRQRGSQPPHGD